MSSLSPQVRLRLLEIYSELEEKVRALAPVCDLSGRCCRFEEFGHRLYLTQPEADLLLEQGLPPGSVVTSAGCPFQKGNLCTAREGRPFGCRVYFCDPKYAPLAPDLSEEVVQKLRQLHQCEGIPWNYTTLEEHLLEFQARINRDEEIGKKDESAASGSP